jgi:transposase-like protein
MKANFRNIIELVEFFKTEEICVKFLKSILWVSGAKCPHCGGCEVMEYKSDFKRNRCKACKKDFSIRQGTIFEDSNIPLKKWFMAMYLFNAHKKGISSMQLAKDISITQKSAWFILHRLRHASKNLFTSEFEGTTEIDEAYIGGSESNRHAKDKKLTGEKEKTVVIGMVNRETKQVKAMKVPTAEKDFLLPKINLNVKQGSVIVTDTYHAYNDLKKKYNHKTVKHSANEYVRNELDLNGRVAFQVHTNSIEGFWSLLKRGINGTYHWVSKKHINKYLAEYSMRYSSREISDVERFKLFCNNTQGKLLYKDLIA